MLQQNYSPNGLSGAEINDFVRYMEQKHVNRNSEYSVQRAWAEFSNMLLGGQNSRGVLVGPYDSSHMLYDLGPFSWQPDDFISDVVPPGSDFITWLPTTKITNNAQYEIVSHLEWIAPNGWDGSGYGDWLATLQIPDCEYGPSTKWNGFQYQIGYGSFSKSTDTFQLIPNILMNRKYEASPRFRLRGPGAGLPLDNDGDFAIARMAMDVQNHLEYIVNFGNSANSTQEWDGLDLILTQTYVSNRILTGSTGTATYAVPYIIDGTAIGDIPTLITELRRMVRSLRTRASKRRARIMEGDMIIQLPLALVQEIGEHLAVNGIIDGITRTEIPTDAEERLNAFMANPALNVDGRPVPMVIDDSLAVLNGAKTVMTTDIRVLTRRLEGEIILEQQYLDYNSAEWPSNPGLQVEIQTELGGIMRVGQVVENGKCFYYFGEMAGRVVSRSQPNQGVINSFSFAVDPNYPTEAAGYTDLYYANFGTPGSIGAGATGNAGF